MLAKLYVIGIGPGDPELLTLKAVRIIKDCDILYVPKGREEGSSLALSIVNKAVNLNGKVIKEAYFPMVKTKAQNTDIRQQTKIISFAPPLANGGRGDFSANELETKWNEATNMIAVDLSADNDIAFLTLGDPTFYSTFYYLYNGLIKKIPGLKIEIVPGISSINAAAAKVNIPLGLGDDTIAVLPANYLKNLESTLLTFNTVVLMKVNKVWDEIMNALSKMNLIERAVCISRAGMEDEQVFRNIRDVEKEKLNYLSTLIVRK